MVIVHQLQIHILSKLLELQLSVECANNAANARTHWLATSHHVIFIHTERLFLWQEHKKNTLTPRWDERKWLMVQEPTTQDLRVEVFDYDRVNVKELLTINLLKGLKDTLGSKTLMGRSAISSHMCCF